MKRLSSIKWLWFWDYFQVSGTCQVSSNFDESDLFSGSWPRSVCWVHLGQFISHVCPKKTEIILPRKVRHMSIKCLLFQMCIWHMTDHTWHQDAWKKFVWMCQSLSHSWIQIPATQIHSDPLSSLVCYTISWLSVFLFYFHLCTCFLTLFL